MLDKLKAGWEVMKLGEQVADPTLWTKRKDFGNQIGLLILAVIGLAKLFGYDISEYIDQDFALLIGGVIASVWNIVLTRATTKELGIPVSPKLPSVKEAEFDRPDEPRNDRIDYGDKTGTDSNDKLIN